MDTLAVNIKRILKEKGIGREELAERLGITPTSVSRLIQGNPRMTSLTKLAEVIGCDVSDFFPKKGHKLADEESHTPAKMDNSSQKEYVYGFLRIGERIIEINGIDDLRNALMRCEVNCL